MTPGIPTTHQIDYNTPTRCACSRRMSTTPRNGRKNTAASAWTAVQRRRLSVEYQANNGGTDPCWASSKEDPETKKPYSTLRLAQPHLRHPLSRRGLRDARTTSRPSSTRTPRLGSRLNARHRRPRPDRAIEPTLALGNDNPKVFVTGRPLRLREPRAGQPPTVVDPPDLSLPKLKLASKRNASRRPLRQYAVTDDFTSPSAGESVAYDSAPVTVSALTASVTLSGSRLPCGGLLIYRELAGSNEWSSFRRSRRPRPHRRTARFAARQPPPTSPVEASLTRPCRHRRRRHAVG